MKWKIPLADLDLGADEEAAVLEVLRRRWLTMGEETLAFESEFAELVGAEHAIAVTNCTAALHLACLALDLGPGDEVILPSLTFVATANAVRYTGATVVFADIADQYDFSISPSDIAAKITPNTKALIVVHYGGYACDMPRIMALARAHNLAVIEDVAHAPGAALNEQALGTWGEIGCFSFFSNKNMTTGEGGMMTTSDDNLAQKLRLLRSHGMTTLTWDRHRGHAWSYDVVAEGYNYRIDEIRAAIGRIQLRKLPANNERRKTLNQQYVALLNEKAPELTIPYQQHPGKSAFHIRPILLPTNIERVAFMQTLKQRGVQSSIHYPPVHLFSAYKEAPQARDLPNTEMVAGREVTLPLYPQMKSDAVLEVVEAVCLALSRQPVYAQKL
ncbi:MAG: DegT/DnrJ/EryC1/StrS family aminotransferase [Candidatus Promineifilaceae bacterium]|nr:DegT/DnrJ/EryC1/StrS family aminotransferase [Candidatus Promineifilaceae bacterium]